MSPCTTSTESWRTAEADPSKQISKEAPHQIPTESQGAGVVGRLAARGARWAHIWDVDA